MIYSQLGALPIALLQRRATCCCCGVPGASTITMAGLCTLVATVLCAVAAAGTGDVFYSGWSMGGASESFSWQPRGLAAAPHSASASPQPTASPLPRASPSASPVPKTPDTGLGRLTLSSVNFCSGRDDTFCTDFFTDKRIALGAFPGGAALRAQALPLQGAFAGALGLGVLTLARLAAACCKAGARGGGLLGYCLPGRLMSFAGLAAACSLAAALAGAWALRAYAAAAAAFFAASKDVLHVQSGGWELVGGWLCGAVAVGLHSAAALLYCWAAARARRALRSGTGQEAAQEADAEAWDAAVSSSSSSSSGAAPLLQEPPKGGFFPPPPLLYMPAAYAPPSAPEGPLWDLPRASVAGNANSET
jgi:hypothetical protein